jgi:hypothetical protein
MFRKAMQKSLKTLDRERGGLLKPVGKYLRKTVKAKGEEMRGKKEVVSDSEEEGKGRRGSVAEQRRKILIPKMRLGGLKKRSEEERRMRQRAEEEDKDAEIVMWTAGITPGEGSGEGEAGQAEDWMLVDHDRVEEVEGHGFA